MPRLFGNLNGRQGQVEVAALGAVIGEFSHWNARRRAEKGEEAEYDDFHGTFLYVIGELWYDPAYQRRRISLTIGGQTWTVETNERSSVDLQGRQLRMERVKLVPVQKGVV